MIKPSIPFNRAPYTGLEAKYLEQAIKMESLAGDGYFSTKCQEWFEAYTKAPKTLLTPSCTSALEMAAMLIDIAPGDEVIMPSYTFVSTANAFVLRGAKIVFVDIRPDTMNINEVLLEKAITPKTKAIVPVHYAGVACEMDSILNVARKHGLFVVEDAAQGMMSSYKGKPLGSVGDFGAFSFHSTKNYTSGGEGGLLIINNPEFIERAEILREKGTNRSQFLSGQVDKYTWVDMGSSYLLSELQAAYLWGQLQAADEVNQNRLALWDYYYAELSGLQKQGLLALPVVPEHCRHNGHMFYLKLGGFSRRSDFMGFMRDNGVECPFHYVPLHSALAGQRFGRFSGVDDFTSAESKRLVRLPLWYGLTDADASKVVGSVKSYFNTAI